MDALKDKFFSAYAEVFDEKGNPKACGRRKCSELIELCYQIDDKSDFGNVQTGIMNVSNILSLKEKLSIMQNLCYMKKRVTLIKFTLFLLFI